jgi:hypothetical protein
MSVIVDDKPIAMWTNQKLREYLDKVVCVRQADLTQIVIAEAVSRLLSAHELRTEEEK